MPPRFHMLRIESIARDTPDAVVLQFAVPAALRDAYRFTPGQYLTLRAVIAGEDVRRSYSICSGLDDGCLQVGIKRVDGGVFSNWAHQALRVGDTLAVMTPGGRFMLPASSDPEGESAPRIVAAFVAGSGITPVLSILRTVMVREPATRFFLFYGNRTADSIMFREVVEQLKDRFVERLSVFHILSREQREPAVLNGRLDADKIRLLLHGILPAGAIDQALICGPQPMMEGLPHVLAELGVMHDRIHVERFTPAIGAKRRPASAVAAAASAPPAGLVSVIYEGVRSDIPIAAGETIIDAAIRAGRSLPFSCKGGMCCTCRARLVEGQAVMAVNYSLEPWELSAGFILTCQASPTTPHVLVDYDQV
jgi:ring-1,2-phenylacetyl-CoA epoxidase subunit PaaE